MTHDWVRHLPTDDNHSHPVRHDFAFARTSIMIRLIKILWHS